ncbi:MAG: hypothetical protein WBC54_08865, partial [Rhodococcus sp. (in: high G+C Gram-positive bacteria)]
TAGLPGAQAPGGGPNVGANAPTNFPTYNGTPIVPVPVPVPGVAQTATPGAPAAAGVENPTGVPVSTATSGDAPASSQPAGSTAPTAVPDRGPGPIPTDTDSNTAAAQPVPDAGSSASGEGADRDRYLELALVGAAAFTAGGIGVRGRRSPVGPRTPESVLSQAVGTVASPLMAYAPGGQSKITVPDPGGGRRTLFLIHDRSSSHESVIPVTVPPGGHMSVDPDGSVTVVDADGNSVSTVAAPWAYAADGTPIPTHYEIRDGHLVQVVDTVGIENILYPILADPPSGGENIATGREMTAIPLYNGQDAISGQPGGIAVVGDPDPGYSPYQPTTASVKDGTDLTVDQGNGTTNRYTDTGTGTDAGLPYTTEPTTDTYQQMAEDQAAAEQAADDAAARAKVEQQLPAAPTTSDSLSRAAGAVAIGAVGAGETGIGVPAAIGLAVLAGGLFIAGMALDRGDGRDLGGHYADGNDGRSGKEAEQAALDREEAELGETIERRQVRSTVDGASIGRYYDGLAENPDGTYTAYEVKSGTARKAAGQRAFDDLVSPDNPATATLNGKTIKIVEVQDLSG